jgi:hypothetical protein
MCYDMTFLVRGIVLTRSNISLERSVWDYYYYYSFVSEIGVKMVFMRQLMPD